MKTIISTVIFSILLTASINLSAQEKEFTRITGGMGYFIGGYSMFNFDELNNMLSEIKGYPEISEGALSLGGGGHFSTDNLIIGGEGHGLMGGDVSSPDYRISAEGGYGFFNVGYVLFKNKSIIAYPLIGIGGGGASVRITPRPDGTVSFEDLLLEPERESVISSGSFMINISASVDYWVLGTKSEGGTGGFLLGFKIGYVQNLGGDEWYLNETELPGSPASPMGGPYFRITMGGGGYAVY